MRRDQMGNWGEGGAAGRGERVDEAGGILQKDAGESLGFAGANHRS
jgi:hypothetical protein